MRERSDCGPGRGASVGGERTEGGSGTWTSTYLEQGPTQTAPAATSFGPKGKQG